MAESEIIIGEKMQKSDQKIKLNIGSHSKRIQGFINVDILELENVDIVHDLTKLPWPFENNSIEEILAQEFFEHIGWRFTQDIIGECYRILKPNGKLKIQVPDIEAMCRMIDLQCFCVPRKAEKYEDYKADPNCFTCNGKAKIHPERWLFAFVGVQKHPYDLHRNIFIYDSLKFYLEKAGFLNIIRYPNIYKLIVEAEK